MSAETIETLKKISEKIDDSLKAAHAAQQAASGLETKFNTFEQTTLAKAINESTKAASEMMELKQRLDTAEKTQKFLETALSRLEAIGGADKGKANEMEKKAREEMSTFMRTGTANAMSQDTHNFVVGALFADAFPGVIAERRDMEIKALIAGNNEQGGFFIRPELSAKMIQRFFETSPMRQYADVQTTNSGSVEIIIDDDEVASGGWVGEVESRPETGTAKVGKLTIVIHEQFVNNKATQTMLDDAGFDIEAWNYEKSTRKMSRIENTAFVVGDGSQKPKGFTTYANWTAPGTYTRNAIEQLLSGVSAQVSADSLFAMEAALQEEYHARAIWAMNRSVWGQVITLKDGQGSYLMSPTHLSDGKKLMIRGKPVSFFQDMQAAGAGTLSVALGDFSVGYTIVDRLGYRVIRDQLTAKPNTLFYITKRVGGAVTNFEAIKLLKLAAA
jgi:HK97 family phage major capsid protein